ncbi:glycoside hydrolase domain-containing protein [Kitasatospora sp. NPDC098652]|uniref:glycoside hydrolase domain-containing protein n=1 Tax=Kitasatospora sp. NPDC098652 TaxID=3364095 RepID=UPI003803E9E0
MHLGFDRLDYPGDALMQSMFDATPMAFTGMFLAPAPSQPNTSWMSKVATLRGMGWGLAPLYVGQQAPGGEGSHILTAAQGTADALDARALAQSAGLEPGSVVYLDIEVGGTLTAAHMAYVSAWVAQMQLPAFRAGVYCSFFQTAQQVVTAVGSIPIWAFRVIDSGPTQIDLSSETAPDPAGSGFGAALAWQYRQSKNGAITLNWTDSGAPRQLVTVDMDSAVCLDPSNPVMPSPVVNSVSPDPASVGQTVTLTGSEFDGANDVAFAGTSATNIAVTSDTAIDAQVPFGVSGQVDVVVSNRWGNQSPPAALTVA